jgi:arylsulfatase A-like enzyme
MPFYEEVAHTPFFVWDPRCGKRNERRQALIQPAIDLPMTLLNFFGQKPTADMLGKDLTAAIARDSSVRDAAIFGIHGGHVNVTDGRYVYFHAAATPANALLYDYGLMPANMRKMFSVERLQQAAFAPPFPFTKGCPLLRVPPEPRAWHDNMQSLMYDLQADPKQLNPITDAAVQRRLTGQMIDLMKECSAPAEQYERLGLKA